MRFNLILLLGFIYSAHAFAESSKSVIDRAAVLKEIRKTSKDYLLGSKEFVAEIQSLIANKKYMEKLDIEEKFERGCEQKKQHQAI
jgi:hypothetical protein